MNSCYYITAVFLLAFLNYICDLITKEEILISLTSLYTAGVLTIFVAIFHSSFYKLFRWKAEYRNISDLNKKIFYVIHLALLLLLLGMGIITLIYTQELSECIGLSLGINVFFSLFWLWRTIYQIFFFTGKLLHYILILLFFLLFATYALPSYIHIIY